jgi:hypothetical protein
MKKIVFLGLVLLLVGSATGFSQNIPQDIVIKNPSADLPKEIAAFSGQWKGIWNGAERNFILVVREIDLEKAEITYATGGGGANVAAACEDITAKVILEKPPKIQFSRTIKYSVGVAVGDRGWYTFEMQGDLKTLKLKELPNGHEVVGKRF